MYFNSQTPFVVTQSLVNALQHFHYAINLLLLLVAQNLPQVNFFGYSFVKFFF